MSINKVILSGNIGNDPEIKVFDSGKKVAKFSLATTDKNKDKTTQWHSIVVWEKLADIVEKYVKKGNYLTVIGSISYRDYTDKNGDKKYFTEINVYEIELPPKKLNDPSEVDNNEGEWKKGEKREVSSMSNASDLPGYVNDGDVPDEQPF